MLYKNKNSERVNSFREEYDSKEYKTAQQNKESKFPYIVDIELTNHCNLDCIFCSQHAMTREKGMMLEKMFKKVIDECAKHNTPVRFIRWGEPFLHSKINKYFEYAKSKGLKVHVTNNGLAIKQVHMKALIDLKVDSIIFSMQGATKEEYEVMRNNNRYDELKENILELIELRGNKEKPFIHVSSTMTNESKEQINSFVKYWGNIVDSVGVGKTNLTKLKTNEIQSDKLRYIFEIVKKNETLKKCYTTCTEVYQKLSVDWDGKVTCCCADYDNYLVVGNLNKSSLYKIWNTSEELKLFRGLLDKMKHRSLSLCKDCYHTYDEF